MRREKLRDFCLSSLLVFWVYALGALTTYPWP